METGTCTDPAPKRTRKATTELRTASDFPDDKMVFLPLSKCNGHHVDNKTDEQMDTPKMTILTAFIRKAL